MPSQFENFSTYQRRVRDNNNKVALLIDNYCQYLNQNKQSSTGFFPYFERKYFIYLLENPNLYTAPYTPLFFFNCLELISVKHCNHLDIADYQQLFDYLDRVNENYFNESFKQKSAHIKLGCELLEKLIELSDGTVNEQITWLQDKIITNLREAYPFYASQPTNYINDDFYPLLTQIINLNLDKIYEKEIIDLMVSARVHFNGDLGSVYFLLLNNLFMQQKYELILKLYHSKSYVLREEVKWIVKLSHPIPPILQEISAPQEDLVKNIQNAILACSPSTVRNLIKGLTVFLEAYFFNVLSLKVIESGKTEENWPEKVADYLKTALEKDDSHDYEKNFNLFNVHLENNLNIIKQVPQASITEYEFPSNTTAQELPSGLYLAIVSAGKTVPSSYFLFAEHFQKVNGTCKQRYQIDFHYFLLSRIDKIINLYEVMGDNAFLFMKKMIQTSVLNLSRYIDNLDYIPSNYYPLLERIAGDARHQQVKNTPSQYDQLISFISNLESLRKELTPEAERQLFQEGNPNYQTTIEQFTKKNSISGSEVSEFLNQKLQIVYKRLLSLPEHIDVDLSVFNKKPNLFLRLLVGRRQLKTPLLQRVFDQCIEHDLCTDVDFNYFAHSLEQHDELGKNLAQHNKNILSELQLANINTDLAFNYQVKNAFSCVTKEGVDWEGIAKAIYADLAHLSPHLTGQQTTLLKSIKTVTDQVTKGAQHNYKPIYNGTLNKYLSEINQQLTQLLARNDLSAITIEFSKHFQEHYNTLDQQLRDTSSKKTRQRIKKNFHVAVWDKNQIDTFVLGDSLSCCLAPDGGQFPAIVQRRMDQAMMMHVIYDEEINEPVCGNWLFFAKNKHSPHEIYIVANFFEIRSGYAHNQSLRDQLVQKLLDFTGKYAQAIGAQGFLLRPLTHGVIPDFEGKYQLKPIEIEKVGNFFSLPIDGNFEAESYYLDALGLDAFYLYAQQDTQLNASSRNRMFTVKASPTTIVQHKINENSLGRAM